MTITKTDFDLRVNMSSSWIIYISRSLEEAREVAKIAATMTGVMQSMSEDWYSTESISEVHKDCRVPKFFHEKGYWATVIEHNNGDWNKDPTYTLYIVS